MRGLKNTCRSVASERTELAMPVKHALTELLLASAHPNERNPVALGEGEVRDTMRDTVYRTIGTPTYEGVLERGPT